MKDVMNATNNLIGRGSDFRQIRFHLSYALW